MSENVIESFHLVRHYIEDYHARTGVLLTTSSQLNSQNFAEISPMSPSNPFVHSREFYRDFGWKGQVTSGKFVGVVYGHAWDCTFDASMEFKANGAAKYSGPKVSTIVYGGPSIPGGSKAPARSK
jgi:hypothetical protein